MARCAGPGPSRLLTMAVLSIACLAASAGRSARAAYAGDGRDPVAVREEQTVEQLVAAVLMTFARFVEWSPQKFSSASAPILVGVVADDAVARALESIARGKTVAGRTMTVQRLQWDSDAAGTQMLYIGEPAKRHLNTVLEGVRPRPVVTVSLLPGFGRAGGMIALTLTDGRISFAVNSRATALSSVRLSSFLLSHATSVSDPSGGGDR